MRSVVLCLSACAFGVPLSTATSAGDTPRGDAPRGQVQCANLIYGNNKTSVCFSAKFLDELQRETNIVTSHAFSPVQLDSAELFAYPFAVMTGEGAFTLTAGQRDTLRDYLTGGGFLVASAGCSSVEWARSFRNEIAKVFPDVKLQKIEVSHAIFHEVYDIKQLMTSKKHRQAYLEGLEIDGKIVVVFSSDGLNDTANAGGKCCCCGGDEITNARQVNVNLLAYALTH